MLAEHTALTQDRVMFVGKESRGTRLDDVIAALRIMRTRVSEAPLHVSGPECIAPESRGVVGFRGSGVVTAT